MKKQLVTALAAMAMLSTGFNSAAQAKDIGETIQKGGEVFERDAKEFGQDVKDLSAGVKSEILSGSTQIITGPSGEAIMLVGGVTGEAATAIASQYASTQGALKCVAKDPLNPFKDAGCVVQYGGETLALVITTAGDGSEMIIVAAASALSEAFNGFARVMDHVADKTGRMNNPLGAFFVLAYHTTKLGDTVIHFALVDVVARSVSILADEGTAVVVAPINALYDIVTLKWKRAGVKIVNMPMHIANAVLNVPVRIIFGKKNKDVLFRTLSPLGRVVNRTLKIDDSRANDLSKSRTGL